MPNKLNLLTPNDVEVYIRMVLSKASQYIAEGEPFHFIVMVRKSVNDPPEMLTEKSFYGGAKDFSDKLISEADDVRKIALKLWETRHPLNTNNVIANSPMTFYCHSNNNLLIACVGLRPYMCKLFTTALSKNIPALANLETSLANLKTQKQRLGR